MMSQLLPVDEVIHRMSTGEFKPNCALGENSGGRHFYH